MNAYDTIIDVQPIESSNSKSGPNSTRARNAYNNVKSAYSQDGPRKTTPFYREASGKGQSGYRSSYVRFGDQTVAAKPGGAALGGLAQIAAGTGLVMIGIPMLILPGPGLLAIFGGMALATNGMRKLLG